MRLQELGIYSEFYFKRELKPLAQILKDWEILNCVFTGVNDGSRKMVAITDSRVIIIFTGLGSADVKVIPREAVLNYGYEKKLLFGNAFIETESVRFEFTNTQRGMKDLFEWAMKRPLPKY